MPVLTKVAKDVSLSNLDHNLARLAQGLKRIESFASLLKLESLGDGGTQMMLLYKFHQLLGHFLASRADQSSDYASD